MSLDSTRRVEFVAICVAALAAGCSGDGGSGDGDAAPGTDVVTTDAAVGCAEPDERSELGDRGDSQLVVLSQPGSVTEADPSIEYPPGAPGGALAYTAVPMIGPVADQGGLHTRVALSDDGGASWTFVAVANAAIATAPPAGSCPARATCSATRVHETSSIVYDASDPDPDRRWKLFTHRYPVVKIAGDPEAKLYYALGHLALQAAPLPSGPWSDPVPVAAWPASDGDVAGAAYHTGDDPATAACGALGEPGATVAPDGSLHLAAACIQPPFEDPTLDIVLLRSLDHGASWSYLATPLTGADGACLGGAGKRVNAAELFTAGDDEYLIATPESPDQRLGCAVYRFDDVDAGRLEGASGGPRARRLITLRFAEGELVHYAGACTAAEGAPATGFTMSHLVVRQGEPPALHEVVSGVPAPVAPVTTPLTLLERLFEPARVPPCDNPVTGPPHAPARRGRAEGALGNPTGRVGISTVVRLALALAAALLAGCFSHSSRECASDADCDQICARTGECIAADSAIEVVVEWTVAGAAPSDVSCQPAAELEVIFYAGQEEATSFAPIPCTLGRTTYDKMPSSLDRVELIAYDEGGAVIDSGSGSIEPAGTTTVTIDLAL